MKRFLYLCAVSLCALLAPARAAEVTLAQLITGKVAPQTIMLKDCTPEWMKFTVVSSSGMQENGLLNMMTASSNNGKLSALLSQYDVYYSKCETVTCNGETFLLVYQRENPLITLLDTMERDGDSPNDIKDVFDTIVQNGDASDNEKFMNALALTPETPLRLSLLNVKSITRLRNMQPVETAKDLEDMAAALAQAREHAQKDATVNNLKQLALAALMYCQENEETFPVLTLEVTGIKGLDVPEKVTLHPVTKQPYHANVKLSEMGLGEIKDPTITPIFYEAAPGDDGLRAVAFVDGHVEKVAKEQWEILQKRWNLQ